MLFNSDNLQLCHRSKLHRYSAHVFRVSGVNMLNVKFLTLEMNM